MKQEYESPVVQVIDLFVEEDFLGEDPGAQMGESNVPGGD